MKLQISLLIVSIASFDALYASDENYGVSAAKNFALVAFSLSDKKASDDVAKQVLNDVADKYGIRNAHFDTEFKQWTIEVGPNCYKAALGFNTINIADYRNGDGLGFEAQAKALREGRVHVFYFNGKPVSGRQIFFNQSLDDKHEKALQNALTRFKTGEGITEASVSRRAKRRR